MSCAISIMPNGSIAYHEERQPQKNVAQINWGTPCSFHLIDPRSLNSVSISTESILELLPVTYKYTSEKFFSSKRTSTKSNEHITDFFCYNVTLFVCKGNKLYLLNELNFPSQHKKRSTIQDYHEKPVILRVDWGYLIQNIVGKKKRYAYLVLENVGNFQIGYKDSIMVLTL